MYFDVIHINICKGGNVSSIGYKKLGKTRGKNMPKKMVVGFVDETRTMCAILRFRSENKYKSS